MGDAAAAGGSLRDFPEDEPRVRAVDSTGRYIHAVYRTQWLRFVNDVELLLDPEAGVVQVRSALRLGYSDLGFDRARVESIRARWAAGR